MGPPASAWGADFPAVIPIATTPQTTMRIVARHPFAPRGLPARGGRQRHKHDADRPVAGSERRPTAAVLRRRERERRGPRRRERPGPPRLVEAELVTGVRQRARYESVATPSSAGLGGRPRRPGRGSPWTRCRRWRRARRSQPVGPREERRRAHATPTLLLGRTRDLRWPERGGPPCSQLRRRRSPCSRTGGRFAPDTPSRTVNMH
jgi:hypothetical protein